MEPSFPLIDEFLGFICGIISQDHDLEEMYLDSFLTIASLDDEGDITKAIEKLDIISEKFKVKFILVFQGILTSCLNVPRQRLSFLYK